MPDDNKDNKHIALLTQSVDNLVESNSEDHDKKCKENLGEVKTDGVAGKIAKNK